jgi:hypothetical protein
MGRGARQQTGRESHQAEGLPDLGVPRQLKLTPSQLTQLAAVEYGSCEEVQDAQLGAALRRIRGRPEKSEAQRVLVAAIAVMAAGLVGLRGEGSVSMEMGRQKKMGLIPVAHVMTAKRDETSFPSGSLERELSNHGTSKPQRASELCMSWLSKSANPAQDVARFVVASIGPPEKLDEKLEEARPHLPIWCKQFGAFLTTDFGRRLRMEVSTALAARTPKGSEIVDTSFGWS